ncbi:MAG: diaminopimelate decarboxylase family protein, partial [Mycobacteriales bacterium]
MALSGTDAPALDPAVWPVTAGLDDGVLTIGGMRVTDLAATYGTPAFLLCERDFRERARAWGRAFVGGDVYYAGKAFLCKAVARWVDEEGLSLDVCTGGELAVALAAGFPAERIAFHGNNKSVAELERAVWERVGRIVVDSLEEIDRLAMLGARQKVMIRVTPGVEAHTHEYVMTGQEDSKFGFSVASKAADDAVAALRELPGIDVVGVHAHIG